MAPQTALIFLAVLIFVISVERSAAGNDAELSSDKEALLAFKAAVGRNLRSINWTEDTSPCTWVGIQCVNRVTELRLPGAGLTGEIPEGTLGRLQGLVALSLRWNKLSGPIPSDLGNCRLLRRVFLQKNSFSGVLQPSIFEKLSDLARLNLAFNRFSGIIPDSVGSLRRLKVLKLQNNGFTGSVPRSATNISTLQQLNVSNNRLNGSIPVALRRFPESSFRGNIHLCGSPTVRCLGESSETWQSEQVQSSSGKKLSAGAIVGITLGALAFCLILVFVIYALNKGHNFVTHKAASDLSELNENPEKTEQDPEPADIPQSQTFTDHRFFVFDGPDQLNYSSLPELFSSSAELLGKGTLGRVFKAKTATGQIFVVKEVNNVNVQQKEFAEQMLDISSMAHSNLLPLRGYYYSKEKKLLVYDYIPEGSLWSILHASDALVDWTARLKIALGVSRAVQFIHSKGPNVAHGNIKSSNVLINQQDEAFLSDFGLLQLTKRTLKANRLVGYRGPEVTDPRKASKKADVYSLGVLLLELLTRKMPNDGQELRNSTEIIVDLPRWVTSHVQTYWTAEVFDVQLQGEERNLDDMISLMKIALKSTEQFPAERPSVDEIVSLIESLRENSSKENVDFADTERLNEDGPEIVPEESPVTVYHSDAFSNSPSPNLVVRVD